MPLETRSRTPEPPYCWQSKEALRKIAAAHGERSDKAHALAVYIALAWFASDFEVESFAIERSKIAERAGVSYRKAADILKLLGSLGIVEISENLILGTKEKGPCTYRLCTVCPTSGTECPRLGTDAKQTSVPRLLKEHRNNGEEDSSHVSPKHASRAASSRIQLVDEIHIAELKTIYQPRAVDKAVADCKAWLITPRGTGKAFSKRRLQTFLRDAEPLPSHNTQGINKKAEVLDMAKAIDPKAFDSYVTLEYPAHVGKWSPTNAPARVIAHFLELQKEAA